MNTKLTITEALNEIKLIDNKIAKKMETINSNISRAKHIEDPYLKDGGTDVFLSKEKQSINDLYARKIKIKTEIHKSNGNTPITIEGMTMTVSEWLVWKKDVYNTYVMFLKNASTKAKQTVEFKVGDNGRVSVYQDKEGNPQIMEIKANIPYTEYLKECEKLGLIFDKLDGQLSLKNATTFIEA